jgi:hypothetical protein
VDAQGNLKMLIPDTEIATTSATLLWLGPATDPLTGDLLRGSAVGYQVIACTVQGQLCDPGTKYLSLCDDSMPYSLSHCCKVLLPIIHAALTLHVPRTSLKYVPFIRLNPCS